MHRREEEEEEDGEWLVVPKRAVLLYGDAVVG